MNFQEEHMKKISVWTTVALLLIVCAAPLARAERKDDLRAIKKAVMENPAYEPGKQVKWFKLLVTDARTKEEKVRLSLPIAILDIVFKCVDDKHFRFDRQDCDIDVAALFAELKKAGPMSLIEVQDKHEIVKIWFE
jgi:hypothetical protein